MKSPENEMFQTEAGPEKIESLEDSFKRNAFRDTPSPEKLASAFTVEIPKGNSKVPKIESIEKQKESIFEIGSETIRRRKPKEEEGTEDKKPTKKERKNNFEQESVQTPPEENSREIESLGTLAELRAKRNSETLDEKLARLREEREKDIPEDTTPKAEKLRAFAEQVEKSGDPLSLIGLKIAEDKAKAEIPESKEQKLSILDRLLAGLRGKRVEKKESISLEDLRAKRLEREIKTAVEEGNALLDAQEKKLPEKDRRLVQSATKKYREQRKVAILTERRPEEEYAGIMSDDRNQN